MTGTAAPLLAGFSITLAAVVVADNDKLRWPGVAALLAVLASVAMTTVVQVGAAARSHDVTPGDYELWFGDTTSQRKSFVEEMRQEHRRYEKLATRSRYAFNAGVILLYGALGSALVPQDDDAQFAARVTAAICAYLAALVEALGAAYWEVRVGLQKRSYHRLKRAAGAS